MDSPRKPPIPSSPPQAAGKKRTASSFLPTFEPLSSPPAALPRPAKRRALSPRRQETSITAASAASAAPSRTKYPTPLPTSSTGILSSPPPRRAPINFAASRPTLAQSSSAGNEAPEQRAPLSAVPCLELPENGEPVLMGRSSNSSSYQLSANRLISRVHVKARYIAPSAPLSPARVEIVCTGWNGLKLHSQGRTWELRRGDSFTSETEGTDLLIDVQEARVMVRWPRRSTDKLAALSDDSAWEDSPRQPVSGRRSASCLLQSSPLRRSLNGRAGSPASPSPANISASSQRLQALMPTGSENVVIYEDDGDEEDHVGNEAAQAVAETRPSVEREDRLPSTSSSSDIPTSSNLDSSVLTAADSFSSDLSEPEDKDPDEENDPIMHSFGPFGPNLSARFASIAATSPRQVGRKRRLASVPRDIDPVAAAFGSDSIAWSSPPAASRAPAPPAALTFDTTAITNHAINQLAYSRLASTPLSTILANLPAGQKRNGQLTKETLRPIIEGIECIGTIERQGKDAAGKPLESEYYYLPEKDTDESRRFAVTDGLGRPSLRNCRKQHKQYYWKRPRTP